MKRTYKLAGSNHKPARILDSIRSDINKYVKRERGKDVPKGQDFWDFECRYGKAEGNAVASHVATLSKDISVAEEEAWEQIYISIHAFARKREKKES